MAPTPTVVPADVAWKARPGDDVAHAFSAGPGWMRSICRRERWVVVLRPAVDEPRCFECAELLDNDGPAGAGDSVEAYRG